MNKKSLPYQQIFLFLLALFVASPGFAAPAAVPTEAAESPDAPPAVEHIVAKLSQEGVAEALHAAVEQHVNKAGMALAQDKKEEFYAALHPDVAKSIEETEGQYESVQERYSMDKGGASQVVGADLAIAALDEEATQLGVIYLLQIVWQTETSETVFVVMTQVGDEIAADADKEAVDKALGTPKLRIVAWQEVAYREVSAEERQEQEEAARQLIEEILRAAAEAAEEAEENGEAPEQKEGEISPVQPLNPLQ